MFEGEEIPRISADHGAERSSRIVQSRKSDALGKMYAKYGDKVGIIVVEDLVKIGCGDTRPGTLRPEGLRTGIDE